MIPEQRILRVELAAINETLAGVEAALIDAGIGPIGNLGNRVGDLAYQRDAARADAESARREGQEIAAGLHEKLAELRAENERLAKQRDELVKACTAKDDLLVCYRIGKQPSETLFKRLDKAKKVLDAIAAEQPKPAGGGA